MSRFFKNLRSRYLRFKRRQSMRVKRLSPKGRLLIIATGGSAVLIIVLLCIFAGKGKKASQP